MKNKIYLDEKLTASDPTSKWISDFVKSDNPKFAGKSKKERIRMALGASYAAKGKSRNEEVEELDEISKKTLGSYVSKASVDMANRTAEGERKRTLAGADYAHNISRGMSAKTAEAGMKKDREAAKPDVKKAVQRMRGIDKAVGRLAKEEVEELDELSKSTLASYAKKAVDSGNTASRIASRSASLSGQESKPMQDIVDKRGEGIKKAVNRLAKEEVEELDELSKSTLASYAKKSSNDARISGQIAKDFENKSSSSRKPGMKAGAARLAGEYKKRAWKREDGTMKAIDRLAKEEVEIDEATPSSQQVKQAIGIARDKRYAGGNVTGAVKAMDKINKGLAQHPVVKKELQKQNEATSAYGRINSRFKTLSGRSLGAAAKEYGDEAKRLQKEIDAQKAENERRKAAMKTEDTELEEKKKGLWDNIHAKRKRGERPARPGEKGYPKTLNIEDTELEEAGRMQGGGKDPCWKGYKMIGTKKKGGREVPNCVPTEEVKELKTFKALREEINGN